MKESKAEPNRILRLSQLFHTAGMANDDLLNSLGLFMRTSALVKILFLNELYLEIKDIPGAIVELGCWRGQNLVMFENLRAIYEPFNERQIIGFDTFQGHVGFNDKDGENKLSGIDYALPQTYPNYLRELLKWHQENNVLKTNYKHEVIAGDIVETLPKYLSENPACMVALAYFDMALYRPTKMALEAIRPRLVRGSVIMLDEFSNHSYPGETVAFNEWFSKTCFDIRQSRYMPNRTLFKYRR